MRRTLIVSLVLIVCAIPLSCTSNGQPTTAGRADVQEDLNPQLLRAVEERDIEKVKAMLKDGADINATAWIKKEGRAPALSETWTPLHFALMMGNEPMAKLLIENGADVKRTDMQGNTPLHFAVRWPTAGPTQLLLSRGADPNAKDRNGITPLHVAATREIVALLIEHGATPVTINEAVNYQRDPAIVQDLIKAGGGMKKQDQDGAASLLSAARLNNKQMVESYLAKGIPVNARDADGRTAMHEAAKTGRVSMVKLLIDKGGDVNAKDKERKTPLDWAMENHRYDLAEFLRRNGAWSARDMIRAAGRSGLDGVKRLLDNGANVNARDENGRTALHAAASAGRSEMLKFLIARGADVNARDNRGLTPLDALMLNWDVRSILLQHGAKTGKPLTAAATKGDIVGLRTLLASGEDINERDLLGETSLHKACRSGNAELARVLIQNGAKLDMGDPRGKTALHLAALYGHADIAKLLIDSGADIRAGDESGTTPLHEAARCTEPAAKDIIQLLVAAGVDVDTKTKYGVTPLCYTWTREAAEYLIAHGAKINVSSTYGGTNSGWTPLHWARTAGVAEVLIQHGANVHARSEMGDTPLHAAAMAQQGRTREDVIAVLIAHGADINAKNKNGETPLDLAYQWGNQKPFALLRQHGARRSFMKAAMHGDLPDVKAWLDAGQDVNEKLLVHRNLKRESTALYVAVQNKKTDVAKLLIEKGADVNACNEGGYSPLHCAASNGDVEMAGLLLTHGANVNAKTLRGITPLDLASHRSNTQEVATLLREHGGKIGKELK